MPRIRIDASPNVLQVDRGENPVMGGLTQGLHSLWEGQNRAAEINREGQRDRAYQEMQLWERQRGMADSQFSHEHTQREEERQARQDAQAAENKQTELGYEGRRVAAEEQLNKSRGAYYEGRATAATNKPAMSERDAWKIAEEQAQHEAIDEFGKPKPTDPQRVQAIHDHLVEHGVPPASAHDPMGLYPHGDALWDAPAAAPAAPAVVPAQPAPAAGAPVGVVAPAAPVGAAPAQPEDGSLWGSNHRRIAMQEAGDQPAISPQELQAAVVQDRIAKQGRGVIPGNDPMAKRRAAFLQLAGDSAPADEGVLSKMLSDNPDEAQAALRYQYKGRPDHLAVAVDALRKIHGAAQQQPAAPARPAPVAVPVPAAQPMPAQAQDPIWDDPVAAGM